MNLVLLFFFIIMTFLIVVFFLSTIRIEIKKLNIKNFENDFKFKKLQYDVLIYIKIYLFNKFPIIVIKIDNSKLKNIKIKNRLINTRFDFKTIKIKNILEYIKIFKIADSNLYAKIGTSDVVLTAFLVSSISTFTRLYFKKFRQFKL